MLNYKFHFNTRITKIETFGQTVTSTIFQSSKTLEGFPVSHSLFLMTRFLNKRLEAFSRKVMEAEM